MLVQLGLPSFETVLCNANSRFYISLLACGTVELLLFLLR